MRKIIALLTMGAAAFAGVGASADPTHGHCTAYHNGSEQGRSKKSEAPPFQALAQHVGENNGVDDDGDDEVDEPGETAGPEGIWDWCNDPENNPKGIGGQPEDPTNEGNEGNGRNGRGKG